MEFLQQKGKGLLLCLIIAIPSWLLGKMFPIICGPVISILLGMLVTLVLKDKTGFEA